MDLDIPSDPTTVELAANDSGFSTVEDPASTYPQRLGAWLSALRPAKEVLGGVEYFEGARFQLRRIHRRDPGYERVPVEEYLWARQAILRSPFHPNTDEVISLPLRSCGFPFVNALFASFAAHCCHTGALPAAVATAMLLSGYHQMFAKVNMNATGPGGRADNDPSNTWPLMRTGGLAALPPNAGGLTPLQAELAAEREAKLSALPGIQMSNSSFEAIPDGAGGTTLQPRDQLYGGYKTSGIAAGPQRVASMMTESPAHVFLARVGAALLCTSASVSAMQRLRTGAAIGPVGIAAYGTAAGLSAVAATIAVQAPLMEGGVALYPSRIAMMPIPGGDSLDAGVTAVAQCCAARFLTMFGTVALGVPGALFLRRNVQFLQRSKGAMDWAAVFAAFLGSGTVSFAAAQSLFPLYGAIELSQPELTAEGAPAKMAYYYRGL